MGTGAIIQNSCLPGPALDNGGINSCNNRACPHLLVPIYSSVILAVVLGMAYMLRVPADVAEALLQSPKMRWYIEVKQKAGSPPPHEQFGDGWVWGMAQDEEPSWCRAIYDSVGGE
jgi:hypothetical protein